MIVVVVIAFALGVVGSSAATAQDPSVVHWLAVGDSFASGEGLYDPPDAILDSPCQRANGVADGLPGGIAWPAFTFRLLQEPDVGPESFGSSQDSLTFVACTGNSSWNLFEGPHRPEENSGMSQIDYATSLTEEQFNVVSLSFGGNNIGFGEVVRDCIGVDELAGAAAAMGARVVSPIATVLADFMTVDELSELATGTDGCDVSEDELRSRIQNGNGLSKGIAEDLAASFSALEGVTDPESLVLVTGYPQLFGPPDRWVAERCHSVRMRDAEMLNRVAGELNEAIEVAVDKAQKEDSRTWRFVDVDAAFEDRRLCDSKPSAMNGFVGFSTALRNLAPGAASRTEWSFHPNQTGHELYTTAVLEVLNDLSWQPATTTALPAVLEDAGSGEIEKLLLVAEGDGTDAAKRIEALCEVARWLEGESFIDGNPESMWVQLGVGEGPRSVPNVRVLGVVGQGFDLAYEFGFDGSWDVVHDAMIGEEWFWKEAQNTAKTVIYWNRSSDLCGLPLGAPGSDCLSTAQRGWVRIRGPESWVVTYQAEGAEAAESVSLPVDFLVATTASDAGDSRIEILLPDDVSSNYSLNFPPPRCAWISSSLTEVVE